MQLKWHAICPLCDCRISRRGILSDSIKCPGCGAALRQNAKWNQNAAIVALVVGLVICLLTFLVVRNSLTSAGCTAVVIGVLVLFLGACVGAWPYATKYDAAGPVGAAPEEPHDPGGAS